MDNREMWEKLVDFHGHGCPGLATGFVASKYIIARLGLEDLSPSERGARLVCITENDACGVDAIQVLLGCSLGKGNLILKLRGKHAFTVFDRETKKGLRIICDRPKLDLDREKKIEYLLDLDPSEIFVETGLRDRLPAEARIFKSFHCSKCGENTMESMLRLEDSCLVCLDCLDEYSRII